MKLISRDDAVAIFQQVNEKPQRLRFELDDSVPSRQLEPGSIEDMRSEPE